MSTGEDGERRVLVDQWHVELLAPPDMDDAAVETLRSRMDASLRQWAVRASLGLAGILVRVEQ
jgi:hypothetical protein